MTRFAERLDALRKLMKENELDAYVIPSTDPNLGEYVPDHWRIIPWLTGFTGSSATVVISGSFSGLWTDSRYFIQAEDQLAGSGVSLIKPQLNETDEFIAWLADNTQPGSRIGLDGRIFSVVRLRRLEKSVKGTGASVEIDQDLISELWNDRPAISESMAFDHDISFCGMIRSEKIGRIRERMKKKGADYHLLTSADDIMWMLNIRGGDVKYSPLLSSFSIVSEEQVLLFAGENKIPGAIAAEFDKLNIVLLPYEETASLLSSLPMDSSILITPATLSAALYRAIPDGVKILEDVSIPSVLKSVKNKSEISNIEKVMVKDGTALTKFFFWLEENPEKLTLTELSIGEKLKELRSEQLFYLGPSFETIAAFNEHGALPHYTATSVSVSDLSKNGILLVDSGGQYLDGTTDITRTIAIGRPSDKQRSDFTLVLKGMINLALAKFPSGTRGVQLDILARKALWEYGINFGHGTGHGVGFCLNVHEGPQSISPGANASSKTVIEPGMLISNEPAIYREGEYGIRIENLILCYEDEETEFGKFLKFETVSLCYIDKNLIDRSLLEPHEVSWLNEYHNEVYQKLAKHLTADEQSWLREKTSAL